MSRTILAVLPLTFSARGGIARFNQMLCLALDRLCPELALSGSVICHGDAREHYESHGAPWKHLRFLPGATNAGVTLRAVAESARLRPDLMLIGLLGMTPVGLACAPMLRGGYGFIAHGMEVWERPRASRRVAGARARFALAVSEDTRQAVARNVGLDLRTIRVLPNTTQPGFENLPEGPGRSAAADDTLRLLTVSRLETSEEAKGVDNTIEAVGRLVARHPALRHTIVGKGTDKPRLVELARSLGLEDVVEFREDVSDEDLWELYRTCSAFVLPSGQEGFGIVFLEAMRFSKPCVGGNAGGTPEVIADGQSGFLVPYGDTDALERALERLLADSALRERMGNAGRTRVLERFTFDRFCERLEGHLRVLLEPPR